MKQLAFLVLVLALALARGHSDREMEDLPASKSIIDPRIHEPIATVAAAATATW